MSQSTLATVIVNNYNYAAFLREAIDSALDQTWKHTEVIVVDDGSTDGSRAIIAGYGNRIRAVLKPNGGQTSALNAGFDASGGSVVFFLDADDILFPAAVERAVALFGEGVAKVHWPLVEIDAASKPTGKLMCPDLPEGDLSETLLRQGPLGLNFAPTSGNAWSRRFLREVFPMPDGGRRSADAQASERRPHLNGPSADSYLSALAPLFGGIRRITEPQCGYRVHGNNDYSSPSFDARARYELLTFDRCSAAVERYCRKLSIEVDPVSWKRNSWIHRVYDAVGDMSAAIPDGDGFILVDGGHWGKVDGIGGRRRILFPERDGRTWGKPANDAAAIDEIERSRGRGAGFMAFAWPAFWWLEYYAGMHHYLLDRFPRLSNTESLVLFDLRTDRRTAGGGDSFE